MESLQAQWERKTFNDWDKQRSKEDDYNRAVEMEIDDDEFLKAVALGTDYEEMRIKILTAMAEDRLEQLEEDYKNGYILND